MDSNDTFFSFVLTSGTFSSSIIKVVDKKSNLIWLFASAIWKSGPVLVVAHTFIPGTWEAEAEAGESLNSRPTSLQIQVQDGQGCLKKTNQKRRLWFIQNGQRLVDF